MISEKHSQAARANGARSRGPVTPEGKAISSRNALRHGLLAQTVLLSNEEAETFEALFYLLVERFSPLDDIEMSAIEEMAAAHWRMRRVMSIEQGLLDAALLADQEKGTVNAFTDPASQTTLALLQRYEARFQHMYNRALRRLLLLRKFPARTPEPNEPTDPNVCNTELPEPAPIEPPEPADPLAEPPVEAQIELTDPLVAPQTSMDPGFAPLSPDIFR
jgi:hypothetical protein